MGVWLGPRGLPKQKKPPAFTYTGQYELLTDTRADGTVDWELICKTSGTLTFSRVVDTVDMFLVGGGKPGTSGTYSGAWSSGYARGGNGGHGGQCVTKYGKAVSAGVPYAITVGDSNEATTALGETATSGGGSAPSNGAYENASNMTRTAASPAATQGTTSFLALWGVGTKYGPGGGGGAASAGTLGGSASSSGAATGGGKGGTSSHRKGYNGAANTGSGGGGGFAINTQSDVDYGTGGAGGSGLVAFRNAR